LFGSGLVSFRELAIIIRLHNKQK